MSTHDPAEIEKAVRTYLKIGVALWIFTAITVAVNHIHLAVPFAITAALAIAATKGSMVTTVFMHLSHEKKWIYGALALTVAFFFVLIFIPLFTTMDSIGVRNASQTMQPAATHMTLEH